MVGWWGGVGGPCDFSVSPSPFGLDFGTLDFGTSGLGLTILIQACPPTLLRLPRAGTQNFCHRVSILVLRSAHARVKIRTSNVTK